MNSKISSLNYKASLSSSLDGYQTGDILVLFGELFQRGYANGLVEAAKEKGMKVIFSTVGRRDENQKLRPLNPEEYPPLSNQKNEAFINLPLECGFDLEPNSQGQTPVDLCKSIGLKEGIQGRLDLKAIAESQQKGEERFREQVKTWIKALHAHLEPGRRVLIAHLMAGGVPRSKIILSLMNRVFKGTGERYLSSEEFWLSDLGQFCQQSFLAVTAKSFDILIEETTELRKKQELSQGFIHYSAYGYHGTPVFFQGQLQWICYTPYLQGFAKKQLEEYARQHWAQGVKATVYNCPEILTNSSSIFPGVEIFLYLLFFEFQKRSLSYPYVQNLIQKAEGCLPPTALKEMRTLITHFFQHPLLQKTLDFDSWPQHSNKELMELMIQTSNQIIELHTNPQQLMTAPLSELIIKATGHLILQDSFNPQNPVLWLGHDTVVHYFESIKNL